MTRTSREAPAGLSCRIETGSLKSQGTECTGPGNARGQPFINRPGVVDSMPWVKADMDFDGIRDLKITRRLGDGSGESAGCFGGRGDSGRALHPSDEFPQMVSFERWPTEVHVNPR